MIWHFILGVIVFLDLVHVTTNREVKQAERDCGCRCAWVEFGAEFVRPVLVAPEVIAQSSPLFGDHSVICPVDSPQRREAIADAAWRKAREGAR